MPSTHFMAEPMPPSSGAGRQRTTTKNARGQQVGKRRSPEPCGPRGATPPIYTGWVVKTAPPNFRFSIFRNSIFDFRFDFRSIFDFETIFVQSKLPPVAKIHRNRKPSRSKIENRKSKIFFDSDRSDFSRPPSLGSLKF